MPLLTCTVTPGDRLKFLPVLELLECVQRPISHQENITAVPAIASVRSAVWRELFPTERNDSVSSVPRTDMNKCGINQLTNIER